VFAVVQFLQKAPKDSGVAVDVADDVEIGFGHRGLSVSADLNRLNG
jgi:hypothetical protein